MDAASVAQAVQKNRIFNSLQGKKSVTDTILKGTILLHKMLTKLTVL